MLAEERHLENVLFGQCFVLHHHQAEKEERKHQQNYQQAVNYLHLQRSAFLLPLDTVEKLLLRNVLVMLLELLGERGAVPLLVEVGLIVDLFVEVSHLRDVLAVSHFNSFLL